MPGGVNYGGAMTSDPAAPGRRRQNRCARPTAKVRPSFVSLEVAATPTSPSLDAASRLELVLPRGIILRIPPGCDRLTLAMVLALLEQRPC